MVGEVAGKHVANANARVKGKVLKQIVRDHLGGAGGRTRVEGWVPRWMAFPPSVYTVRCGVGSVAAHALVIAARADGEAPEPETPGLALALPAPSSDGEAPPLAA